MTTPTTTRDLITHRAVTDPWGQNRALTEEYREISKALNEQARDNWDNEAWHRQVAADLATFLDYGFQNEALFSTYIQTENVGEFDRAYVRERRGLKVFYTARGGEIDESQLRDEVYTIPRDTMGFHVVEFIDKLRADFATSIATLATLGQQKMEAEINRRILSLAQAAVPNTSASYTASSGLTKAELDTALRFVRDAIQANGVGRIPVTILGRAAMIDKISDFDGFADEAKEEIRLRGRLGVYKGANVVEVTNYTDEDDLAFTPANELWVLGGTAGKFVLYGGMIVKSWDENVVDYRHYRARRDLGGIVAKPNQVARIVDSSVTP